MTSARAEVQDLSDRAVAHVLRTHGTGAGRRSGWLMISTILIEAWDLYAISFILVFLKAQFNPGWLLLGLTSAAVQAGAVAGALSGGWLADKAGRRPVFLGTMAAFVVLALVGPARRTVRAARGPRLRGKRRRHRGMTGREVQEREEATGAAGVAAAPASARKAWAFSGS